MPTVILIIAAVIIFAFLLAGAKGYAKYYFSEKKTRHRKFIKQSSQVLQKLDSFDGEFADARKISYLRQINPLVFEELLLSGFARKGWKIKRNKRYTGDGGVDGEVRDQRGKSFLIQAKRYKGHIKRSHLDEFADLCRVSGKHGKFIHTGRTGKGLIGDFRQKNVEIISGSKLVEWLTK